MSGSFRWDMALTAVGLALTFKKGGTQANANARVKHEYLHSRRVGVFTYEGKRVDVMSGAATVVILFVGEATGGEHP